MEQKASRNRFLEVFCTTQTMPSQIPVAFAAKARALFFRFDIWLQSRDPLNAICLLPQLSQIGVESMVPIKWLVYTPGRLIAVEARETGHTFRVIRLKEPNPSKVVFRDELQVAVLPNCRARRI